MFDLGASHSGKAARFAKPLYGLKPYQGFESFLSAKTIDFIGQFRVFRKIP